MELIAVLADPNFQGLIEDLRKVLGKAPRSAASAAPTRQKQRRLSTSEQHDLVGAYREGETLRALAEQFGIHPQTVSAILEGHAVPRRYEVLTGERFDAASLYASGLSLAQVGEHFGVDASTVQRTFKRCDISRRTSSGGVAADG